MSQDELKRAAGYAAVEAEVRPGMKVGLGSGSTALYALHAISERLREGTLHDIVGVPTSKEIEARAKDMGIPLTTLDEAGTLDVTIDGADEIDPSLDLIKGLGGALLREKMVAQASWRLAIVADASKLVDRLGQKSPLPVEVIPFGWRIHLPFLEAQAGRPFLREKAGDPYVTDNGNYIIHCDFDGEDGIEDPAVLDWQLLARAGIVGHGLFLDLATVAYVASEEGVKVMRRIEVRG